MIRLERVAHGGFVVGRLDGKVVFVTGGLPGELVRVEITERGRRFDRGRVVEVVEAAPGRVQPPCPIAGECGGCDWQHADAATQLDLKTAVVAEQLTRLAGIDWAGRVEAVPGGTLGWRSRMRYMVGDDDRVGLRARRSHVLVELPEGGCRIAMRPPSLDQLRAAAVPGRDLIVASHDGGATIVPAGRPAGSVRQAVAGRRFEVAADGFWQPHREAAAVLTAAVLDALGPRPGQSAFDLYCGVGLFAGALADAGCAVVGVEASRAAIRHARGNVPEAQFVAAPVERALPDLPERVDLVVLDPPRKGAGADVVAEIVDRSPRAVAYVACDPAALARDLATFAAAGYAAEAIRAFDLFPMTHHVECVAALRPRRSAH